MEEKTGAQKGWHTEDVWMKFLTMTESEYDIWSAKSRREYAEEKMAANNLTRQEGEEIAAKDFARLLPEGFHSKDNYFFTLKDDKEIWVGSFWFNVRGAADNRKAFLCDIVIDEKHRGQGYGRAAMKQVEVEAKKLSLKEVGLHVFGNNEKAIRLYQSMGYKTVDLVMAKPL